MKKEYNIWLCRIGVYMLGFGMIPGNESLRIPALLMLIVSILWELCFGTLSKSKYKKGGYLSGWYDKTLKHMGMEWIRDVFEGLVAKELINTEEGIVFVSPTANKGSYEKYLFKYLSSKGIKSKFIVSDREEVYKHEQNEINAVGEYIYKEQKDANSIEDTLAEESIEKVDIIMDFKGFLWYSMRSFKAAENARQVQNVLKKYSEVLTENGVLIIDNTRQKKFHSITIFIQYILLGIHVDFEENSTQWHLMKLLKKNGKEVGELKQYLEDNFSFLEIRSASNPKVCVIVLQKKN